MKVVYRADIEIDVPDTRTKHMAVFEASKQWPELRATVEGLGSGVTIKRIQVERRADDKAQSGEE